MQIFIITQKYENFFQYVTIYLEKVLRKYRIFVLRYLYMYTNVYIVYTSTPTNTL